MTTLYKLQDGQLLIITGHLNKQEINMYKHEGYRLDNPLINRNGIYRGDGNEEETQS